MFFFEGTAAQIMVGILISVFCGLLYGKNNPFVEDSDNTISNAAQLSVFFVLFVGLALRIDMTVRTLSYFHSKKARGLTQLEFRIQTRDHRQRMGYCWL